jgi:hypothetical protein
LIMSKASNTPTTTRRALALGSGAFAAVGLTAGAAAMTAVAAEPALSPIMVGGRRLSGVARMQVELDAADRDEELDRATVQGMEIAETIYNSRPETLADAAILLMAAADDVNVGSRYVDIG